MIEIRTTQANPNPDIIDFGIGQPSSHLLPLDIMREAAAIRLADGDPSLLHYGYELGDGYFRLALAGFLEQHYGIPVNADTLMVSAGVSQALDLICSVFTRPGDLVFVEEPTYFLAPTIFADHHLRVVGLPTDGHGLNVEALASALVDQKPAFVYTIPAFQNPSGVTLSPARRQRLIDLSGEFDFLIVADEVYQLLDYSMTPPPPLASFIDNERVLSTGSFSKILAPGLRLGWIQAAPALLQRLAGSGLVDSGGGINPFTSNLVRIVLERGWQDDHLANLKGIYRRRAEVMREALNDYLPGVISFIPPAGGFFFWLALAEEVDTVDLLASADEYDVGFKPGIKFSSRDELSNYLRLSFAFYDEDEIQEGIERLARCFAGYFA